MSPDRIAAALLAYEFVLGDKPADFSKRFEAMAAAIRAADTYGSDHDAQKLPSDTNE